MTFFFLLLSAGRSFCLKALFRHIVSCHMWVNVAQFKDVTRRKKMKHLFHFSLFSSNFVLYFHKVVTRERQIKGALWSFWLPRISALSHYTHTHITADGLTLFCWLTVDSVKVQVSVTMCPQSQWRRPQASKQGCKQCSFANVLWKKMYSTYL